jgi:hypothetical protein
MNTISRTTVVSVSAYILAVASAFIRSSAAASVPTTKEEHIAAAKEYEAKAAEQDAIAVEHFEMMKQYRARAHRYPKQVREKRLAAMRQRFTAIIRDARRLAADYRAMAKWHRTMGADLEDQPASQED